MSSPWRFRWRLLLVLVIALATPVAITILFKYPPTEHSFYPRCAFNQLTGLHCPGCGITRCLHALVHGDFVRAVRFNPLFFLVLLGVAWAGWQRLRVWRHPHLELRRFPGWSWYALFWIVLAFWILRNIDVYPCSLLAPELLQ